jgi:hypothetical protein
MEGESKALAFSYRVSSGFLRMLNYMNVLDRKPAPIAAESVAKHYFSITNQD